MDTNGATALGRPAERGLNIYFFSDYIMLYDFISNARKNSSLEIMYFVCNLIHNW